AGEGDRRARLGRAARVVVEADGDGPGRGRRVVAAAPDVLAGAARVAPERPGGAIGADGKRERLDVRRCGRDLERGRPRPAGGPSGSAYARGRGACVDPGGKKIARCVHADPRLGLRGRARVVRDLGVCGPGRAAAGERTEEDVGVAVAAVLPHRVAGAIGGHRDVWEVLRRRGVVGDALVGGPGRPAGGKGRAIDVVLARAEIDPDRRLGAAGGAGDTRVALHGQRVAVVVHPQVWRAPRSAAGAALGGEDVRLAGAIPLVLPHGVDVVAAVERKGGILLQASAGVVVDLGVGAPETRGGVAERKEDISVAVARVVPDEVARPVRADRDRR